MNSTIGERGEGIVTNFLIMLLCLNALIVAIGLAKKRNMWQFICLYWIILTVKNAIDMIGGWL